MGLEVSDVMVIVKKLKKLMFNFEINLGTVKCGYECGECGWRGVAWVWLTSVCVVGSAKVR